MSFKNSSQRKQSIHKLHFHDEEKGSVFIEVLFTFVAQIFLSLGVIILFTQIARAEVMSFQDWKKLKLNEAQIQSLPSEKAASTGIAKANKTQKLEASKLAMQIAQELTIEDYFALYLSQFKDRSDFVDAAKKLNPNEMGDLLLNLKNSLDRPSGPESPQNLSFSNLNTPDAPTKK